MQTGIDRPGALDKAFEFVYKSEIKGDYCEFGVYQGVSMLRALQSDYKWRKQTNSKRVEQFFGFDSFTGLPRLTDADSLAGYDIFYEGQFSDTSVENVVKRITEGGFPADKVNLFPGLFSGTLSAPEIVDHFNKTRVAIAHIDCDLYSSALECLDFLDGRLADGSVILFDDWFCYRGRPDRGVHKAFEEWCAKRNYMVSDYFTYSWAGRAFIVNLGE